MTLTQNKSLLLCWFFFSASVPLLSFFNFIKRRNPYQFHILVLIACLQTGIILLDIWTLLSLWFIWKIWEESFLIQNFPQCMRALKSLLRGCLCTESLLMRYMWWGWPPTPSASYPCSVTRLTRGLVTNVMSGGGERAYHLLLSHFPTQYFSMTIWCIHTHNG